MGVVLLEGDLAISVGVERLEALVEGADGVGVLLEVVVQRLELATIDRARLVLKREPRAERTRAQRET